MTPDLCGAVALESRWRVVDRDADGRPSREVAEIAFRRREWGLEDDLPVRVIAVRTRERERGKQLYLWDDLDWTVQVYLSNDMYSDADALAWKYDQRAGIEPLIAEWKTAWGIGKHSCASFNANAAAMQIKLLAHNLLHRHVEANLPELQGWRTAWVRRAVIRVPGRIVKSGRSRTLRMQPRPVLQPLLQ